VAKLTKKRTVGSLLCALAIASCTHAGPGMRTDESSVSTISERVTVNPNRGTNGQGALTTVGHSVPSTGLGAIAGNSAVRDGVFTYTLPIDLPQGRAGFTPVLGLNYASVETNGPLGVGWAIAGMSQITRCPHNLSRDGYAAGPDFALSGSGNLNMYCLDGNKLFPTSYDGATANYQTESADFSKITASFDYHHPAFDPDSFVVYRKDGTIYTYGLAGSALDGRGVSAAQHIYGKPTPDNVTYAWNLSSIRDRNGDKIVYHYTVPYTDNVNPQLSSITYNGHIVSFHYTSRPDAAATYAFGFDTSFYSLIDKITVSTGNQTLWTYALSYSQSQFTNASELNTVTKCDAAGVCLMPTTFTWNQYTTSSRPAYGDARDFKTVELPNLPAPTLVGDLNGDGIDDIISLQPGSAYEKIQVALGSATGPGEPGPSIAFQNMVPPGSGSQGKLQDAIQVSATRVVDMDGDGTAEVILGGFVSGTSAKLASIAQGAPAIQVYENGSLGYIVCHLVGNTLVPDAKPNGLTNILASLKWNTYPSLNPMNLDTVIVANPFLVADYNGDGLLDLATLDDPSNASGTTTIWLNSPGYHFQHVPGPSYARPSVPFASSPIDIDGDRRADLASIASGSFFADFNGDGLPDLVSWTNDGGSSLGVPFTVGFNLGHGYTNEGVAFPWISKPSTVAVSKFTLPGAYPDSNTVRLGDFNGDAKTDILLLETPGTTTETAPGKALDGVTVYTAAPRLAYSTGSGFVTVDLPYGGRRDKGGRSWPAVVVGDFNGDGLTDILQPVVDGWNVTMEMITAKTSELGLDTRRDVITNVMNGLVKAGGGSQYSDQVSYLDLQTLAGLKRYKTSSALCGSPLKCAIHGLAVNHFYTGRDNTDTVNSIEYSYDSALVDTQGRGYLGYASVSQQDYLNGSYTTTTRDITCVKTTLRDDFSMSNFAQQELSLTMPAHAWTNYVAWNAGVTTTAGRLCYPQSETRTNTQSALLAGKPTSPAPAFFTTNTRTNKLVTGVMNDTNGTNPGTYYLEPANDTTTSTYSVSTNSTSVPTSYDAQSTTDYTIDILGNVTNVTTTVNGGTKRSVDRGVLNDRSTWLIGQLQSNVVTLVNGPSTVVKTTDFDYDSNGRVWHRYIEPNGGNDYALTTTYGYNADGTLQSVTDSGVDFQSNGSAPVTRSVAYTYDAAGNPSTLTDGMGHVTHFVYDPNFDTKIAVIDPNGVGVDFIYDGFGNLHGTVSDAGPATLTTEIAPPHGEALTSFIVAESTAVGVTPCASGQTSSNGLCFVSNEQAKIDIFGRPILVSKLGFDGTMYDVSTDYDAQGHLWHQSKPFVHGNPQAAVYDTFAYDAFERPISVTHPDQSSTTSKYPDAFSRIDTDENGVKTTFTYNVDGQLTKTSEPITSSVSGVAPSSITTSFIYDAAGNVTQTTRTSSDGVAWSNTAVFDQLDRPIEKRDPASGITHIHYNAFGEIRQTDTASQTRNISHDALGRIIIDNDPNNPGDVLAYTWDPTNGIGKLSTIFNNLDQVSHDYVYDSLGRLIVSTQAAAIYQPVAGGKNAASGALMETRRYAMRYTYDGVGRLATTTFPTPKFAPSVIATNEYNDNGFLAAIHEGTINGPSLWAQQTLTPWEAKELTGDGVVGDTLVDAGSRRVTDISYQIPGNPAQEACHYTYQPNGNVWKKTNAIGGQKDVMSYDSLNRLEMWDHQVASASGQTRTYFYDAFGSMLATQTYDDLGNFVAKENYTLGVNTPTNPFAMSSSSASTSNESTTYRYDLTGRRTAAIGSLGSGTTYNYNRWNLPTQIDFTHSDSGSTTFQYDATGKRAVKTEGTDPTIYLDDQFEDRYRRFFDTHTYVDRIKVGRRVVAEISEVFVTTQTTAPSESYLYPHTDLLGSPTLIGWPQQSRPNPFAFEPFGMRVSASDGFSPGASGDDRDLASFTGDYEDLSNLKGYVSGLIDMHGREYDASTRRFLTPDPLVDRPELSQGYNPYSYVRNNPETATDPTGYQDTFCDELSPCSQSGGNPVAAIVAASNDLSHLFGGHQTTVRRSAPRIFLPPMTPAQIAAQKAAQQLILDLIHAQSVSTQPGVALTPGVSTQGQGGYSVPNPSTTGLPPEVEDFVCNHPVKAWGVLTTSTIGAIVGAEAAEAGAWAILNGSTANAVRSVALRFAVASVPAAARVASMVSTTLGQEIIDLLPGEEGAAQAAAEGAGSGLQALGSRINPAGLMDNCGSCAVALDRTLGGAAASAIDSGILKAGEVAEVYGKLGFSSYPSAASIEQALLRAGDGARGIVLGGYGPGQVGHFFNAVNQGGTVVFLDSQIGAYASTSGFQSFGFLMTFKP